MLISFLSCLGPLRPQLLTGLLVSMHKPRSPSPWCLLTCCPLYLENCSQAPLNHPPIIQVSAPTSLPLRGRFPIYCGGSSHLPVTPYSTSIQCCSWNFCSWKLLLMKLLFVPITMPDSSYKRFKTFLIHKCSTKKYLCSHLLKYVPRSLNPIISSFPKSKISSMIKEAVTVS